MITAVFEQKIKCIELKKSIAFCQMNLNAGKPFDAEELQQYLTEHMAAYYDQLSDMVEEQNAVRKMGIVDDTTLIAVKKVYFRIAKQLHPDINPLTQENEQLMELWYQTTAAYRGNDLQSLEELEVLVQSALKQAGGEHIEIVVPDIQNKILALEIEIANIMANEPYTYKNLLNDEDAVKAKKDALTQELDEYKAYIKQLKARLSEILPQEDSHE